MPGDFFLSCIRPRLEESETLDIRYMHFPIAEWIVLTEQEVSEKSYEKCISCRYTLVEVIVISSNKRISEVP